MLRCRVGALQLCASFPNRSPSRHKPPRVLLANSQVMEMTSKAALRSIESNLDIEKLIREVQARAILWDVTLTDYSDRMKRKQCWEEITELFASGNDLTLDDKKKLGDILHKKWKNIRDRFTRYTQELKGKSKDRARKKTPYMYSQQLEFLRDTVALKRNPSKNEREEEEHEDEEEEEDELQEGASVSSSSSFTPNALNTCVTSLGKKRVHSIEENSLHSFDNYEKRAKTNETNEVVADDYNRHFLLSLVPSLASLPRHLNTRCRIELMECINKYEMMSQTHQQALTHLPNQPHSGLPEYNSQQQQQPHQLQPIHHIELFAPNQQTMPTLSPAQSASSAASCSSNFVDND